MPPIPIMSSRLYICIPGIPGIFFNFPIILSVSMSFFSFFLNSGNGFRVLETLLAFLEQLSVSSVHNHSSIPFAVLIRFLNKISAKSVSLPSITSSHAFNIVLHVVSHDEYASSPINFKTNLFLKFTFKSFWTAHMVLSSDSSHIDSISSITSTSVNFSPFSSLKRTPVSKAIFETF